MDSLTGMIKESPGSQRIKEVYDEYSAHSSKEAKYVKSLDLFDMYLQAYEYELLQGIDLSEFFSNVDKNLSDSSFFEPQVKLWLKELMHLRENKVNILAKDSNLNTILRDILIKI